MYHVTTTKTTHEQAPCWYKAQDQLFSEELFRVLPLCTKLDYIARGCHNSNTNQNTKTGVSQTSVSSKAWSRSPQFISVNLCDFSINLKLVMEIHTYIPGPRMGFEDHVEIGLQSLQFEDHPLTCATNEAPMGTYHSQNNYEKVRTMSREGNPLQIWACKQAVIVLDLIFFWGLSGPDWYVNVRIPRYFPITQIDSLKLARSFCQTYPYLRLRWDTRLHVKWHHMLTLIGCFWCHFVADTFWTNEWIKLSFVQINTSSH